VKVTMTRRYRFAASHRLHSGELSEPENQSIYGKCNNPHGHGHNYEVLVTVAGPIDAATGMIANLGELDPFVHGRVVEPFDHRNLNEEVAEFRDVVPTTENLCIEIFRRLKDFPAARVARVRVEETSKNSFEVTADES
jgi:6-pyruvoyltetrahydropterin/6-carboxytetrahydropterin synthase